MQFFRIGLLLFSLVTLLTYCSSDKGKKIPDVSQVQVEVDLQRFEQDLMAIDTLQLQAGLSSLMDEYPLFAQEVFFPRILPALQDTNTLKLFLSSPGIQKLYDTSQIVFGNANDLENELAEAFRFYKHYFPENPTPKVVTFISEYTLGAFTMDREILGIGLDFYLGADYPYYDPNFFPDYIKRNMTKAHLVPKAIEALASDLVGQASGDRLLDLMINNGKTLYIMDLLLPRTPDSLKLGYTALQTQWCKANEFQIWSHFLREDLLYSAKRKDIRKLVDYSPSSPGMPAEAPGRTANWVGWQIVKSYMRRHPEASLNDLIALKDAQQLLDQAKYKPRQ